MKLWCPKGVGGSGDTWGREIFWLLERMWNSQEDLYSSN